MKRLIEDTLTEQDLAKYPFIVDATEYVKENLGLLRLNEVLSTDFKPIFDRAILRIKDSATLTIKELGHQSLTCEKVDPCVEILSFPLAVAILKLIGDSYFEKRFALFEAKKASLNLENEAPEKMVKIATKNFGWKVSLAGLNDSLGEIKLHFKDYLKNAVKIREDEWKLVNQLLIDGEVYLTRKKVARLLEEEIRKHIEAKFNEAGKVALLDILKDVDEKTKEEFLGEINKIKNFIQARKKDSVKEFSFYDVKPDLFPPCIKNLYMDVLSGKDVPHIGRFTLTAFLIQIGVSIDEIVKIYTSATDFDERITRYQVEHIAGVVGGKTKYKPLNCGNMKTHGLCLGEDKVCEKVKNPLTYYSRALKASLKRERWKQKQ
ncbi:MAG: DNA primase large subunit PriL [Candidatus Bathyarchaeota archaeon]|nr:DNA primase large subunit PriL [Candidatus Bathyarchaeota archaeon]